MAKIISSDFMFSGCNNAFVCKKLDNLCPGMIKMQTLSKMGSSLTVRSPAGGELFLRPVVLGGQERKSCIQAAGASNAKTSISIGKSLRWWEKGTQPNMKEITGAEDLVESLTSAAGDKLVVVDFFSPGCGGCKSLHPKICQLAEMNPDIQFLQVNYEDHRSMCYSLNVHVLPFFRFYRGAEGRVCSFSCTNATIKKFKDALAKHKPDRCSLGLPKGLEEKELVALGANLDLSFTYTPKPDQPQKEVLPPPLPVSGSGSSCSGSLSEPSRPLRLPQPMKPSSDMTEVGKDKNLVSSGR